MKNPFYHAFTPGFNWWYVVAILGIIVVALVGWNKYYIYAEHAYRKDLFRRYNNKFIGLVSTFFTIVVMIMVCIESADGIVQFLNNGLEVNESPAWSVIVAPFVLIGVAGLYWTVLEYVGLWMAKRKKVALMRRLKQR